MKLNLSGSVIIILIAVMVLSGCNQDKDNFDAVITNEKIIETKDFYVNSDSTDLETSVRGTVFLSGEEGVLNHAQIVLFVVIDPNDWGGVGIHLSDQWNISGITSSFPEGEKEKIQEDYVGIWSTKNSNKEWSKWIEIGRDIHRWTPTGGGKGTIVIDLAINKETMSPSNVFRMTVGVGSKEKDGIRSVHPDWKLIEIPIPRLKK